MTLDTLPISMSLHHSGPNQPCTLTPVSSSASGFVQPAFSDAGPIEAVPVDDLRDGGVVHITSSVLSARPRSA